MRTVYVIHDSQDRAIVEDVLIRPLPILGVDHWLSSQCRGTSAAASDTPPGGLVSSDVVLAVVSEAAIQSAHVRSEIAAAVDGKRPLIPVRIDSTDPQRVSDRIAALPWVALRAPGGVPDVDQLRRDIGDLLPSFPEQQASGDADDESVPEDYRNRTGYDPGFLGAGLAVLLPKVVGPATADVLTFMVDGRNESELRYEHFSVVMSRSRRMCRFSAVNIDGKQSKKKKRVGWRFDPRIPRQAQIREECYGDAPKFARGHMTRREDPVWGTDTSATTGNADSMHVTNTVPQMQVFNAGVWLGLEDYALDHTREDNMRISVFTGPFLANNDPVRDGVAIPRRFWKVIVFVHDETGELCATGYTMSQEKFLRDEEFVFGAHETAQVSVRSIEQGAGVSFGAMADLDPIDQAQETVAPQLTDFSQIRFVKAR
jgi:DNA/RNA endonuclease G (NUC1)